MTSDAAHERVAKQPSDDAFAIAAALLWWRSVSFAVDPACSWATQCGAGVYVRSARMVFCLRSSLRTSLAASSALHGNATLEAPTRTAGEPRWKSS